MRIASRMWPTQGVQLPVMETGVGDKRLGVTVVVGDYATDTVADPGNDCIRALADLMDAKEFGGTIHRVDMGTVDNAGARVAMILAVANSGDGVVFLCRSVAVFNAVVPHLRVVG